jgi:hypothetical protein
VFASVTLGGALVAMFRINFKRSQLQAGSDAEARMKRQWAVDELRLASNSLSVVPSARQDIPSLKTEAISACFNCLY